MEPSDAVAQLRRVLKRAIALKTFAVQKALRLVA
jgi:hypothetical protein